MPSDPASSREPLVLVVEDDPSIATMISLQLELSGYRVHVERDGVSGLAAVRSRRPAIVLLDIGLPGLDGIEVCRRLRSEDDWTPILFVTARDDEVDRVVGIELGADDYVTKPFSPREVIARVGSILRRSALTARDRESDGSITLGEVRLRPDERRVTVRDTDVTLTATEFDLLHHLMATPARVWTREQLLEQVWGYDSPSGRRTVDVHVAQVRAKLGDDDVIRTVRGVGYSAEPPRRAPS